MKSKLACIKFLKLNGFKKMESNSYANDLCNIVIDENNAVFADNQGNQTFLGEANIYTIIGWLTYYNYIPKDYKIK